MKNGWSENNEKYTMLLPMVLPIAVTFGVLEVCL